MNFRLLRTMNRPKKIVIVGELCSGKTTLAKFLEDHFPNSLHVESSSVVRDVIRQQTGMEVVDRKSLSEVDQYDDEIQNSFLSSIANSGKDYLVFSGLRKWHHLNLIQPDLIIWIDCDDDVRFRRFCDRKDEKDRSDIDLRSQFEMFDQADKSLGEIKAYIDNKYSYFCLTNDALLERMKSIRPSMETPTIIFDNSKN